MSGKELVKLISILAILGFLGFLTYRFEQTTAMSQGLQQCLEMDAHNNSHELWKKECKR